MHGGVTGKASDGLPMSIPESAMFDWVGELKGRLCHPKDVHESGSLSFQT